MFCSKCGANVAEGAAFCSVCGAGVGAVAAPVAAPAPAVVAAQQYEAQKLAVRQGELNSLNNAFNYFSQRGDLFDEFDRLSDLVDIYAKGPKAGLLVWGCIIATIGLLMIGAGGVSLLFLLPGGAMIAGGIMMKVVNRKKLAQYQAEYDAVAQALINYYNAYPNCPVGIEYAKPATLALIIETIQSGRADTVKESINTLVNDYQQELRNAYLSSIDQTLSNL